MVPAESLYVMMSIFAYTY